jgi:hypothetical protein
MMGSAKEKRRSFSSRSPAGAGGRIPRPLRVGSGEGEAGPGPSTLAIQTNALPASTGAPWSALYNASASSAGYVVSGSEGGDDYFVMIGGEDTEVEPTPRALKRSSEAEVQSLVERM